MTKLISSVARLKTRIREYQCEVNERELAARISSHKAWYAVQDEKKWLFGPSKYIGYDLPK
jgi:hypothetical protein